MIICGEGRVAILQLVYPILFQRILIDLYCFIMLALDYEHDAQYVVSL